MKEIQQKQRFDLLAVLAVLGVVLVLGFESIFIFELYRVDPAHLPPVIRTVVEQWLASPGLQEEAVAEPVQQMEVAASQPVLQEVAEERPEDVPVETNTPPVEVEDPSVSDEEAVPVG